jgi:hypothetical protein
MGHIFFSGAFFQSLQRKKEETATEEETGQEAE